jgi:hypothetical protein
MLRHRCGGTLSQKRTGRNGHWAFRRWKTMAQRAVLLLLEPIYEADFLPCSYGFRPGKSARDALMSISRNTWIVFHTAIHLMKGDRRLASVTEWCRRNLHRSFREQHAHLSRMIRGHCAYYGISGNGRRIRWYHHRLERIWKKWLDRRGRHSNLSWPRFRAILARYPLPRALIVHQYNAT